MSIHIGSIMQKPVLENRPFIARIGPAPLSAATPTVRQSNANTPMLTPVKMPYLIQLCLICVKEILWLILFAI